MIKETYEKGLLPEIIMGKNYIWFLFA